jgi:hypothetical protein
MIDKKSTTDLSRFYKLAKRGNVTNSQILGRNFSGYIESLGQKINEEVKDPIGNIGFVCCINLKNILKDFWSLRKIWMK